MIHWSNTIHSGAPAAELITFNSADKTILGLTGFQTLFQTDDTVLETILKYEFCLFLLGYSCSEGAHCQSENWKLFLREADSKRAVKLLQLATASCVGQAVESKAILPRRGVAGPLFSLRISFLDSLSKHLVATGCLAKPCIWTDKAWSNYLAVCGCWFPCISEISPVLFFWQSG